MTKSLLLMRHAKSSWSVEGVNDFDRPLDDRGRRDAPLMAARIAKADLLPDVLICSTALRAMQTAELFAESVGFEGPIGGDRRLYHATPDTILAVTAELGGDADRLLVIGHNPGMEHLVERLTGFDESMPTAAVAVIDLPIETWANARSAIRGTLAEFWTPKDT